MLVWLFQTGEPLHIDLDSPRPMRAMNLSNALVQAGHRVVLWSSAFHHLEKRHRTNGARRVRVSDGLEIRLIPSRGYKRNVGAARLIDHAQMAVNLRVLLREERVPPDVAFIGYPPIETAAVLSRWLARRAVPVLLDVKDQWPTLFLTAAPALLRPLAGLVLWPYFRSARRTMRDATGLSAMTDSFLNWALALAGRQRRDNDAVFPLTSPVDDISEEQLDDARRWWDIQGVRDDGRMRVMFVGSHSRAFDFKPIQEAAKLTTNGPIACEWIICGAGDSSAALRSMMFGLKNVHFPGWIDRPKLMALAERCSAALAPYHNTEDFQLSLPNKVLDALSAGLPIISPLEGEVASLITTHGVGLRYGRECGVTLYDCITKLSADRPLYERLTRNARAVYAERFSFQRVYGDLVEHLERLAKAPAVSGRSAFQAREPSEASGA